MSSDATPDPDTAPEQYVRRAELLADLGRYEEAAAELRYAIALEPANREALTLLARVHLAAGQPTEALAAAESATRGTAGGEAGPGERVPGEPASGEPTEGNPRPGAAMAGDRGPGGDTPGTPTDVTALGARAMALIDLRRFAEAAEVAEEILRRGPDDPDALCTGAALLSESRNGQRALNAAWRAVELAPDQARSHLVLGLVAARLKQFQLAERAYREALELDPSLAEVHRDIGVIHLEQRRYAEALAELAEAAAAQPEPPGRGRPSPVATGLRALLHFGAGYALLAPMLIACAAAGNSGLGRLQALAMGIIGLGILGVLVTRLPGRPAAVLAPAMRADRALAVAVYAVAAGPCLVLLYALIGSPWSLVAAVGAGFAALLANLLADR